MMLYDIYVQEEHTSWNGLQQSLQLEGASNFEGEHTYKGFPFNISADDAELEGKYPWAIVAVGYSVPAGMKEGEWKILRVQPLTKTQFGV